MNPSMIDLAQPPARTGKTHVKRLLGLCVYFGTSCLGFSQWSNTTPNGADYNNSANWVGGVINDTFTGNAGWGGNPTIWLTGSRTVAGDFTFVNTFDNSGNSTVKFIPDNGVVWSFTSANPTFIIDPAGPNGSQSINFGDAGRTFTLDFKGNNAVFNISPGAANYFGTNKVDTFNLAATGTNAASFTKIGAGVITLDRSFNVTGAVNINNGSVKLIGGNGVNIGQFVGATALNVTGRGSVLDMGPGGSANTTLLGTTPIHLNAGALAVGLSASNSQSTGRVYLDGGRSVIANYHNDNTSVITTLTLDSLVRQGAGATVNFVFANANTSAFGAQSPIKITTGNDANILSSLIGGGGAAGSTNISILPWATAVLAAGTQTSFTGQTDTSYWGGTDLVTYSSAGGFRALTASEYYVADGASKLLSGAGATDNVNLTVSGATVSSSQTINALKIGVSSPTTTIAAGQTLTVTSGAIVTGGNPATFTGGKLSSGTNALIISGRSNVNMDTEITNSITNASTPGLIVANMGNVILWKANSYGGSTVVQGYLTLAAGGALPKTSALQIDNSGTVTVNAAVVASSTRLSGSGLLQFATANNGNRFILGATDGPLTGANNTVTVNRGGVLSPGDTGRVGALTLGNNVSGLTLNDGGVFEFSLASASSFDRILSTNAGTNLLTINGGALSLSFLDGYNPEAGTSWTLTSGFNSTAGLASGVTVIDTTYGYTYTTSFVGNNLVLTLTSIPEPSSIALWAGGLAFLGFEARRRMAARREMMARNSSL